MTRPLSGIYKITNQLNGKCYIGQSKNVYERKAEHFTALRRNRHPNREMQKDWNKSNRAFRFDVVEWCGLKELNEKELEWIKRCGSMGEKGYNLEWVPYTRKIPPKPMYKPKKYHRTMKKS